MPSFVCYIADVALPTVGSEEVVQKVNLGLHVASEGAEAQPEIRPVA